MLVDLYRRIVVEGTLASSDLHLTSRKRKRGIYTASVVLWLMILQRLHPRGTLSTAVSQLACGRAGLLLADCKRVRENRISTATGAYCRARMRFPKSMAEHVTGDIVERLREQLAAPWPGLDAPVFVLDGSSLRLRHSRELLKAFPAGANQHGPGHWPILLVVVLHEVQTGLAQRPCWGPMYGPRAVSEQALAEEAMKQLPPGAAVIADRNFGIFSIAWAARQQSHPVVVRLTAARACRLMGGPIAKAGQWAVTWKPTRWDQARQYGWPEEAGLDGRLVAARVGRGKSKQWLYLFTTLPLPAEQIVAMYGERWNVETDLRALKQTVRLSEIQANSVDMMEKELLLAVSAYNLVRAVMCLAARQARIEPRQLSFTRVLDLVNWSWPHLLEASARGRHDQEFNRILTAATACKLPQRKKHRSYPRATWNHGESFPKRKSK